MCVQEGKTGGVHMGVFDDGINADGFRGDV